jgi:hypothetical protein
MVAGRGTDSDGARSPRSWTGDGIFWAAAWQAAYAEMRTYGQDEVVGARACEADALERAEEADHRAVAAERAKTKGESVAAAAESRAATTGVMLAEVRARLTVGYRRSSAAAGTWRRPRPAPRGRPTR